MSAFTLADRTPTYYLVMVRFNGMTITAQGQTFPHAVMTAAGYLADQADAAARHGGPYAEPGRAFAHVFISNGRELRAYSGEAIEGLNADYLAQVQAQAVAR